MLRLFIAALTAVFIFSTEHLAVAQNADLETALDQIEHYSHEGQNLKVDSMLEIVGSMINSESPEKSVFAYKYYTAHSLMSKWKLAEAEPIFEEALNLSYEMNDSAKIVAALSGLATLNNFKGNVFKAIQLQETAKETFSNGDSSAYYGLVANLGVAYNSIKQYDKSLSQYLSAKKYYEKIGASKNLALLENNIGELYRERFEDFEMAQKHYANAIEINKSIDNKSGLAMNYHNMALNFLGLEQHDSALSYIKTAIELREQIGQDGKVASDYCVLGDVYTAAGEFEKASQQYDKTLTLSERFSITPGYYYANLGLANLYKTQKKYNRAERFAFKAIDVATEMNSPGLLADMYDWLYHLHKEKKNFEGAIGYLEKFEILNDSLENARDELFLNATKTQYEADLSKADNEKLKLKQKASEAALENDRLIKIGLIVLLVILTALALVIFKAYKMKARALKKLATLNSSLKKSNDQISEQKEELKKLNDLKTNIVSVLGHDLRGPLVNVSGVVSLLKDKTINRAKFEEIIRMLDEKTHTGLKSLDMVLEWSRLEAGDSKPKIEPIILKKVIDEIVFLHKDSIADKSLTIKTEFDERITLPADPNQFFSIVHNLISNAIKFSLSEGMIKIGVEEEKHQTTFYVHDSGVGFSDDVLSSLGSGKRLSSLKGSMGEEGTGIGLRIVSDFIEAHGGELIFQNHPEGGALVSVLFPKNSQLAKAG